MRKIFGEKILDMGNLGAGALIFGQAVSAGGFNMTLTLLGVAVVVGLYSLGYLLLKGGIVDD